MTQEKKNKVVAASLIHDRIWVLPYFLKYLAEVEGVEEIVFLANNCSREEMDLIEKYGLVYEMNDVDSTAERVSNRYRTLTKLRNRLMDVVFNEHEATHILSVDSDILVYPNIVKSLLEYDKDFISALVYNDLHCTKRNHIGNIMNLKGTNGLRHIQPIIRNVLRKVDMTGAVFLMSRKIYDAGVRYEFHSKGEDPGFAKQCREKGFQQWCLTMLQKHVMSKKILEKCIEDGTIERIMYDKLGDSSRIR